MDRADLDITGIQNDGATTSSEPYFLAFLSAIALQRQQVDIDFAPFPVGPI
jgi:hypothetical protein